MRIASLVLALVLPAVAQAQSYRCEAPATVPDVHPEGPSASEPARMLPTVSYTLAVSWAPQFCHGKAGDPAAVFECGGANRFGFTLHGLWPDGEGALWPQYCAAAVLLPRPLVRQHLCSTPSAQLLQHEYAKHGTCMGVPPADYFARSTGLYARLRYPDMAALAARRDLTAGAFAAAVAQANPGMSAEMMRLNVNRGGWLEEVWLCLDLNFRFRACPATQGGAAPETRIKIEPLP